jgi:primosomal protein N' (replication factor Y)
MTKQPYYYEIDVVTYGHLNNKIFTYAHHSTKTLQPGQLVNLSFGRQKSLGIILAKTQPVKYLLPKIKPIDGVIDGVILPQHTLDIAQWLKTYYVATNHAVWGAILPSGLLARRRQNNLNTPPKHTSTPHHISLSQQQNTVLNEILQANQPVLLSGVTGSGKTHVYEQLIHRYLSQYKSVLYLSPEIFLTQQLEKRLSQSFADNMVITHSGLSAVQRRNIWLDCLKSLEPKLYLGPRSSLFLPINNLGLIIIDEAHDTSYKQENSPRYQAREVAAKLARLTHSKLVLGSATHNIVMTHLSQLDRLKAVELTERHAGRSLPSIKITDMKGLYNPLSPTLIKALRQRLQRGEQSLLLHNKRGSARRFSCDDCGNTISCPRCDTSLVFHADQARLICHICNFNQFPPSICPACKSSNLRFHGFGTKQLVEEVKKYFPQATLARIDRDLSSQVPLKEILTNAEQGKIDILIGTQMIAKGLDFPRVTLVGIVAGDELLFGDDYQSRERGVALIMQAAGRAGRGELSGEVIIQTRQPDNPLWDHIRSHNWSDFTAEELKRRHNFGYPPYQYLARINFFGKSPEIAQSLAEDWLRTVSLPPNLITLGPATPNHARTSQGYIAHIICKSSHRTKLTQLAHLLPRNTSYDIDPISIF